MEEVKEDEHKDDDKDEDADADRAKKSGELNGMDTEDSINIDLAEDELLNEEVK